MAHSETKPFLVVAEAWPPFEFEENGVVKGIDVDIAMAIFKKMNIQAEIKTFPWARVWKMIEDGKADACMSTSRKEKRKPFLYYPKEDMWVSEFVFFVNKSKKKASFTGYNDAKGMTIGTIRGNSYHPSFWDAKFKTDEAKDLQTCFKKLAAGRVDLVPADKTVGLYTLSMLGLKDKIDYYSFVLYSKGYPMPFAKKSNHKDIKEIAERFEQELIKMKKSGEYDKIREKWLGGK